MNIVSLEDFRKRPWAEPDPKLLNTGHWTNGKDLYVLLKVAKEVRPEKICEMYCSWGHTARALARNTPKAFVYTYDVYREILPDAPNVIPRSEVGREFANTPERERILPTVGPPTYLYNMIRIHGPYRLVYVDGDHSWRWVRTDTIEALETLSTPGAIVWDDYWVRAPGTMKFLEMLEAAVPGSVTHVRPTKVCYAIISEAMRERLLKAAKESPAEI